jgi:hypothetical protein
MFLMGKMIRGTRTLAAWVALGATISLVAYEAVEYFGQRNAVPWWAKALWLAASLIVALFAGVMSFPRWQSLVAIAAGAGAIALLVAR